MSGDQTDYLHEVLTHFSLLAPAEFTVAAGLQRPGVFDEVVSIVCADTRDSARSRRQGDVVIGYLLYFLQNCPRPMLEPPTYSKSVSLTKLPVRYFLRRKLPPHRVTEEQSLY